MRDAPILDLPRVGVEQFPAFVAAQDAVHGICTAIGARVKSGSAPAAAIEAEMSGRFSDGDPSAVSRFAQALMAQLIDEYRYGKRRR